MLQNFVIPQIDEDDLQECAALQQDDAPPHLRADVEQFLNDHFPDRWAGIGGQIA
jgi:hypothetical protein